jgi:hypothetical protein
MKTKNTLLLMAAFMLSAFFIQAQNTEKKPASEFRTSGARSMITKKSKESIAKPNVKDQKNYRELVTGTSELPSAITFQSYDVFTQKWHNEHKMSYTWFNDMYEQETLMEIFMDDELLPNEKSIYIYNEEWELQEVEIYTWNDSKKSWELTAKELTHTDSYGNLVLEADLSYNHYSQQWDTLPWSVKFEYVYTSFGMPEEMMISEYWNQEWVKSYKDTYNYDMNSVLQELTLYYYDESYEDFVPEYKEVYSYNEQNEWSEVMVYYWFFDEWYVDFKVTDFQWYNFTEKQALYWVAYMEGWDSDPWEPYFRKTFEYHPELHEQIYLLEENYDDWGQEWVPDYREIIEFDEMNIPVLSTIEYYEDDAWEMLMGIRNSYILNAQGEMLENISEWWDIYGSNTWVYWFRMLFEYETTTGTPVYSKPIEMAQVYPNPVTDNLRISMNQQHPIMVVNVYNSQGQLMMDQVFSSIETQSPVSMDFSRQQPGIYVVQVQAGGQTQMMKIVKK